MRSWFIACWLWRRIQIVTYVTNSPVVISRYVNADVDEQWHRTPITQVFLVFFYTELPWYNRNWPIIRSALLWLVRLSGTALIVPAGAAVVSTDHSSADPIMVNSHNNHSQEHMVHSDEWNIIQNWREHYSECMNTIQRSMAWWIWCHGCLNKVLLYWNNNTPSVNLKSLSHKYTNTIHFAYLT